MVGMLFLLEGLLGGIETFFFGGNDADGDEEAEETNEGVYETHNLPEDVVATISSSVLVHGDIGLEVPHHEGPETPGDEVLNGEAPISDEDVSPPFSFLGSVLIGTASNHGGELVGTVEEDLLSPFFAGQFLLDEERNEDAEEEHSPEDDSTDPHIFFGEGKDGDGSHNESSNAVPDGDNHSGHLGAGISE